MAAPQTTVALAPDIGFPGLIPSLEGLQDAIVHDKTSKEASAAIPFGVAVKNGTLDDDVLLMTAAANKLAGVTVFAHDFARNSELTSAGLQPGTTFGVVWWGPVIVQVEDAVTPASGVHIRHTANAPNNQPGSFRATADAGKTIDASAFCRYMTSAGAGGFAVVWVDFDNQALAVAD